MFVHGAKEQLQKRALKPIPRLLNLSAGIQFGPTSRPACNAILDTANEVPPPPDRRRSTGTVLYRKHDYERGAYLFILTKHRYWHGSKFE